MSRVHERLEEAGIDQDRLSKVITSGDDWGHLVHAFEALTTMGIVLETWDEPAERTPRIEAGEKVVLPDGQVRQIAAVRHQLDEANDRDTTTLIVELTDRWLPNVS